MGQRPFGQPKLTVNLFYVDGLLIDSGPSRLYRQVLHAFDREQIDQIFITHHHEDHTGNVAKLSEYFECPALSTPKCAELMKDPPKISFAQYLTWGNRPAYHGLQGAETLTTEKYSFALIPIPGHAPDMVALYEPQKKWLFTATCMYTTTSIIFSTARACYNKLQR